VCISHETYTKSQHESPFHASLLFVSGGDYKGVTEVYSSR